MTDRTALIADRPADDLPRLVYADWLDEHGQPAWAEYVRNQVRMGELVSRPQSPAEGREFAALSARRLVLIGLVADPVAVAFDGLLLRWNRGFAVATYGRLAPLQKHLPALLPVQPIGHVGVSDRTPLGGSRPTTACGWFCREPHAAAGADDRGHLIPASVFRHMIQSAAGRIGLLAEVRFYDSHQAAHADLSQALIAEARTHTPPEDHP